MDFTTLTSVIFNDVINDITVNYHLISPKNFNLVKKSKIITQNSGQNNISKKRRRRGRPRKEDVKKSEEERRIADEVANDDKSDENVILFKSTRYGRVSRPPKHMSKFVDIKDARVSVVTDLNSIQADTGELQTNFNVEQQIEAIKLANTIPEPKKVRKNVDRFTCRACNKVYLGRKKMIKHFLAYPDHKKPIQNNQPHTNGLETNGTNSVLFDELMKIVSTASQKQRIHMFLAEISNFVNKVRFFKPKLLQTQGIYSSTEYYVDKNVSKVLDLTEGLLQLNDRAFDESFQQTNNTFNTFSSEVSPLEYNLNLFPQGNYDQISDNAVEAEVLGKSNESNTVTELSPETHILDISFRSITSNNKQIE